MAIAQGWERYFGKILETDKQNASGRFKISLSFNPLTREGGYRIRIEEILPAALVDNFHKYVFSAFQIKLRKIII
ncbi:hypothetical protein QNH14_00550 [Apirhabdus apintestini]|nr:hypothetical protein QNH14_00550 [Enterobacteriaceae bacterium CA-0114]